ncbi:hypothetical protein GCM10012275_02430 [Longimycelium tulufanense]|uniref:Uncharacterized protein n=1 Tax=Longimycelium tulufanense TaxID=907463 RepID=A0A8J3C9Z5_9PSEU|nr:hypothetical protein [Longimycelium tulufanense]GGM34675.1 hypothetical protein GCM10012275_02430 [Longimycelium tulufanense]
MAKNETAAPVVALLRLAEEKACTGYLAARKAQMRLGARVMSLRQLVTEHPSRTDYRAAWNAAALAFYDAVQRTRLAYAAWHRAQVRTDAKWTATESRVRTFQRLGASPRTAVIRSIPSAAVSCGEDVPGGEAA